MPQRYHQTLGILIVLLAVASLHTHALERFIQATDKRIGLSGRYYVTPQGNAVGFDWPCFTISLRVQGACEVEVVLTDDWNRYEVVYDGDPARNYTFGGQSGVDRYSVANLTGDAPYQTVQIHKITENHYGPFGSSNTSLLRGVVLRGAAGADFDLIAFSANLTRRVEVFSDSDSNGFGIATHGTSAECIVHMKQYQNCYSGWASQLAARLTADLHVEAWSGKGVAKNAIGIFGPPMPYYWTHVTTNSANNSWQFSSAWVPDGVIVLLGSNDLINVVWPTKTEFEDAYLAMLNNIGASYAGVANPSPPPRTKLPKVIVLCNPKSMRCDWQLDVAQRFNASYAGGAYYVELARDVYTPQDAGCIGHVDL